MDFWIIRCVCVFVFPPFSLWIRLPVFTKVGLSIMPSQQHAYCGGKAIAPCLWSVTDGFQLKTHWAEVQVCFVRLRYTAVLFTSLITIRHVNKFDFRCVINENNCVIHWWRLMFLTGFSSRPVLRGSPTLCRSAAFCWVRGPRWYTALTNITAHARTSEEATPQRQLNFRFWYDLRY
jgi:hypothetical protein